MEKMVPKKEQRVLNDTIRKVENSAYLLNESIEPKNKQLKTGSFMIGK